VISTPGSLITFTMRAMGILGVGQSALAEDYTDVFDALNAMLATWNRKRYLIWHLIDIAKLSTGVQSYTVGASGDFITPRPDRLESAFFRQFVNSSPNQVDFPLQIIQAREDYNRIALKQLTSSLPTHIFYDSAFPVGVIYPYPIPPAGIGEIHITVKDTLTGFVNYTQQINLPPEFFRALWSNLALDASALYPGSSVSDQTRAIAKDSLATIRGANTQIPRLSMPRTLRRRNAGYNIFSDGPTYG